MPALRVAASPRFPEQPVLFVATNGAGVLRSADSGRTWSPTGFTEPLAADIALSPGAMDGREGDVTLDILLTESAPFIWYAQASNTGTEETTEDSGEKEHQGVDRPLAGEERCQEHDAVRRARRCDVLGERDDEDRQGKGPDRQSARQQQRILEPNHPV